MNNNIPWIIKYEPKTVGEMILKDDLKTMLTNMVGTETLSNMAIFGTPGIGKSTLSKILVNTLDCEYLFQPCSIDGSIDMIKSKIKDFCEIVPLGKYKVVILDEADQLSQTAQMALRNIIVDSMKNCRFILTANYQDKIIDALKSRCTPIKLDFSQLDVIKYCVDILQKENVEFTKADIMEFNKVVKRMFPDVRSIIERLQMMSASGRMVLTESMNCDVHNDVVAFIKDNINLQIKDIRQYLISNEDKFSSDYVLLAQELFNAYVDNAEVMYIISDALWRMSFQLDKEIQFTGMLINIKKALKL